MIEQNNPIDIGDDDIAPHKEAIEEILSNFFYQGETHSMTDLMQKLDPAETHMLSDLERATYVAIREGMQVFKAVYSLLGEKVELKKQIIASSNTADDPVLDNKRGFCGNYSSFAAASYIVKKMQKIIDSGGGAEDKEAPDLSHLELDNTVPEEVAIKRLLAPLFLNLIRHAKMQEVFADSLEFPLFVKDVFQAYARLCQDSKELYKTYNEQLAGYQFRIMDEFVVLNAYQDESLPMNASIKVEQDFQPIRAEEIVGNRAAKIKIQRYMDRLALYDSKQQMNPIMELGGLSWSNLFDGPPGTGKSSIFRLAMTLLSERCAQTGMPYHIITVDQSIKDEFYGKTGKLLLQKLNQTQDSQALSLVIFDDIDLLTSTRSDAQGADNDINNIIMQYLDGVYTVRRGNVINFAASNKPTGLDNAMRNRFSDRLLIDGPTKAEDFSDMLHIMAGKILKNGLIAIEDAYTPFASQSQSSDDSTQTVAYMAEEFDQYKNATVKDFGEFMYRLKEKNPLITGRSMKAILDAIMERCADFDVPQDWFENSTLYFEKTYDEKVEMLKSLYKPITPDVLYQEASRYFDSEQRYAETESEENIEKAYQHKLWDTQAQIKYYQDEIAKGNESAAKRLQELRLEIQKLLQSD